MQKKEYNNFKYISWKRCDTYSIKKYIYIYILRILYVQYNKSIIKNCENSDKLLEKHKSTS